MKQSIAVLFLAFCILTPLTSIAQMAPAEQTTTEYVTNKPITPYPSYERISGSPYETKEFELGNIMKDGEILANNVALRYNVMKDEIEVKSSLESHNRTGRVMVKASDIYAKIFNKTFVYVPNQDGLDTAGYFVVVFEGDNYNLFKKITKEYIEGAEAMTSLTRDIPAMYKEKEFFYLVEKSSGNVKVFPNSRSAKFNLFGDKKKALKRYASEEKLNINKDYALLKIVKHFDTL